MIFEVRLQSAAVEDLNSVSQMRSQPFSRFFKMTPRPYMYAKPIHWNDRLCALLHSKPWPPDTQIVSPGLC
jgi:hypothetical protein